MNDAIPTVGVLVSDGDKVLLVAKKNHPDHHYQLPGGAVEGSESMKEAAVRELLETTGLNTDANDLEIISREWEAKIAKDYGTKNFSFKCFLCKKYSGEAKETESAIPEWVSMSDVKKYKLVPNTLEAIMEAKVMA